MTEHLRSAIVGTSYHSAGDDMLNQVEDDTLVHLTREPDNPHDPNAIAVFLDGIKCGYIPRLQAVDLAPDIDAGRLISAHVHNYNKLDIELSEESAPWTSISRRPRTTNTSKSSSRTD